MSNESREMSDLKEVIKKSPRLTSLQKNFFSLTARGEKNIPRLGWHDGSEELMFNNKNAINFLRSYRNYMGLFERHFASSVPYILENECRIGESICKLNSVHPFNQYSLHLGSSEGPLAKTLAKYSDGRIQTIAHSDSPEHKIGFDLTPQAQGCHFLGIPSVDLSLNELKKQFGSQFDGFDYIFEHQLFHFYSPDRKSQVKYFANLLRDKGSGAMFFTEKMNCRSREDYLNRERVKDWKFKSRYFSVDQIISKQDDVCSEMIGNQVSLPEMIEAIKCTFAHVAVIWNSGNFYQFVASNNEQLMADILEIIPPSFIPDEFVHENLPIVYSSSTMRTD